MITCIDKTLFQKWNFVSIENELNYDTHVKPKKSNNNACVTILASHISHQHVHIIV